MKTIAAILLAALAVSDVDLAYAPKDSTLVREYEAEIALSMEEMSSLVIIDGEEQESPSPELDMSIKLTSAYTVRDEISGIENGRPKQVLRTFQAIATSEEHALSSEGGDQERTYEGESELEGTTVRFEWDADEDEYSIEYVDEDEGDEELLEDLHEDMDFRNLLPDEAVAIGATWEVEVQDVFRYAFYPAGRVPTEFEGRPRSKNSSMFYMIDALEGDATAELVEIVTDPEGSSNIARIVVRAKLSGESEEERESEAAEITIHRRMDTEFEASIDWDIALGRVSGMELEGDISLIDNVTNVPERADGPGTEFQTSMTLSGSVNITYSVSEE